MVAREEMSWVVELPVTLRLARFDDLPKLEWYGQYTHFRNLFRRAFREQQQHRRLMLVADCNDFPIGHVFIQLHSTENGIADGNGRAYLYALRVMDMFRGQGIGTRLYEQLFAELKKMDIHAIIAGISLPNEASVKLHERLGFAAAGTYRQVGFKDGRWHDVGLWQRALAPAATPPPEPKRLSEVEWPWR